MPALPWRQFLPAALVFSALFGAAVWAFQNARIAALREEVAAVRQDAANERMKRIERDLQIARLATALPDEPEPAKALRDAPEPATPAPVAPLPPRPAVVETPADMTVLQAELAAAQAEVVKLEEELRGYRPFEDEFVLRGDETFSTFGGQIEIGLVKVFPSEIQVRFEGELMRMAQGSVLTKVLETHDCSITLRGSDWQADPVWAGFGLACRLRE